MKAERNLNISVRAACDLSDCSVFLRAVSHVNLKMLCG